MAERAFMIRAGNDNELIDEFESRSLVAVGREELGDVSDVQTYEEMESPVQFDRRVFRAQ